MDSMVSPASAAATWWSNRFGHAYTAEDVVKVASPCGIRDAGQLCMRQRGWRSAHRPTVFNDDQGRAWDLK
jgi:hypothetical protein